MKQSVTKPQSRNKITDTGLNKAGLFARVSDGQSFQKLDGGFMIF